VKISQRKRLDELSRGEEDEDKKDNVLFSQQNFGSNHANSHFRKYGRPESAPLVRPLAQINQEETTISSNLYSWGFNYQGQCGFGTSNGILDTPALLKSLPEDMCSSSYLAICCSETMSVVVSRSGKGYAWGKLDSKTETSVPIPVKIPKSLAVGVPKIASMSCGSNHAVAALDDGFVIGWGCNTSKQLGMDPLFVKDDAPIMSSVYAGAFYLRALKDEFIKRVYCGSDFTICTNKYGTVLGIGNSSHGQLGVVSSTPFEQPSILYKNNDPPLQIACGNSHTVILVKSGKALTFGIHHPAINDTVKEIHFIHADGEYTLAISKLGQLYLWYQQESAMFCSSSLFEQGIRISYAVVGYNGKCVAVSTASNVYIWENETATPHVIQYFTSNNIIVNHVAFRGSHYVAGKQLLITDPVYEPMPVAKKVSKEHFTIWGCALKQARIFQQGSYKFHIKYSDTDFDDNDLRVAERDLVAYIDVDPEIRIPVSITYKGNLMFEALYSTKALTRSSDQATLSIMLNNMDLCASPYPLQLFSTQVCPKSSIGHVVESSSGLLHVTLESRDSFGNKIDHVAREWRCHVYDADRNTIAVHRLGNPFPRVAFSSSIGLVYKKDHHAKNSPIELGNFDVANVTMELENLWVTVGDDIGITLVGIPEHLVSCCIVDIEAPGLETVHRSANELSFSIRASGREGAYEIKCMLELFANHKTFVAGVVVLDKATVLFHRKGDILESMRISDTPFVFSLNHPGVYFEDLVYQDRPNLRCVVIDQRLDTRLKQFVGYVNLCMDNIVDETVSLRVMASLVNEWTANSLSTSATNCSLLGEVICKSLLSRKESSLIKFVLFKYLCDIRNLPCRLSKDECFIQGTKTIDILGFHHFVNL